jgi:hypothetical protein
VFSLILKKPNTVCTRYPGVHSTFTCYQPNLRLNPPNATPLSMSRALSLSLSFPVPGSFPFLAITRPVSCPVPGSLDPWSRCGLRRAAQKREEGGGGRCGLRNDRRLWSLGSEVISTMLVDQGACAKRVQDVDQTAFATQVLSPDLS